MRYRIQPLAAAIGLAFSAAAWGQGGARPHAPSRSPRHAPVARVQFFLLFPPRRIDIFRPARYGSATVWYVHRC